MKVSTWSILSLTCINHFTLVLAMTGGNKYQLQAFGKGTNLHTTWDSGLIGESKEDAAVLAEKLLATQKPGTAVDLSVVRAAEES